MEASAAFRNLQVFTPDWADFFCVEPVSHVPDALNRPELPADQAMHVLRPNETLGGTLSLIATAVSPSCSDHSRMASAASGPERISTNRT
jgi:aldose 1-epimerase